MHLDANHEDIQPGHQKMSGEIGFLSVLQLQLTFAEPYMDAQEEDVSLVSFLTGFRLVFDQLLSEGCSTSY